MPRFLRKRSQARCKLRTSSSCRRSRQQVRGQLRAGIARVTLGTQDAAEFEPCPPAAARRGQPELPLRAMSLQSMDSSVDWSAAALKVDSQQNRIRELGRAFFTQIQYVNDCDPRKRAIRGKKLAVLQYMHLRRIPCGMAIVDVGKHPLRSNPRSRTIKSGQGKASPMR